MGERFPGPVCQATNPSHIDRGTSSLQCSPRPSAKCRLPEPALVRRSAITVGTVVFDEAAIVPFLQSVAHAKSMERHVKLRMQTYDESKVLNFIYTVLWWKGKPVTFDVDLGDQRIIEAETAKGTKDLQESFINHACKGPKSVTSFMKTQEGIRASCLGTVAEVFREVRELSNDVITETQRGIFKLSAIKATSTIVFKGLGLAAGGVPSFLVDSGYDIALEIIQEWDKAEAAELIGVATKEVAKDSAQEATKQVAEKAEHTLEREAEDQAKRASWLGKRVAEEDAKLAKKVQGDLLRKYGRDSRRLATASRASSRASLRARVVSRVKYLFFAKDVYDAIHGAREDVRKAGGTGYSLFDG